MDKFGESLALVLDGSGHGLFPLRLPGARFSLDALIANIAGIGSKRPVSWPGQSSICSRKKTGSRMRDYKSCCALDLVVPFWNLV